MAVPEEYRNVARPKNTICKMIGNKCAVIERIGCKRVNGKNIPINGSVIGHIIDGQYVAKEKTLEITMKDYGDYAFAKLVSKEVYDQLIEVYGQQVGNKIYAISLLRCLNPDLTDYRIEDAYLASYLSIDFPYLKLSKSSISAFIYDLGRDASKILSFARLRTKMIEDNEKILIDGMLKSNDSKVNGFSAFSYKGKVKSRKDISLMVAWDYTRHEELFSFPYPGNSVDITIALDFIEKTNINNAIIIGDKGMFKKGEKLGNNISIFHPIKRNSKVISTLDLYNMDNSIETPDGMIQAKKNKDGDFYYYAFRDLNKATLEKNTYLRSHKNGYDIKDLAAKESKFGTVVFESNLDMSLADAYSLYDIRWEIEAGNNLYKNIIELSSVREQKDESIMGGELINTIALIIASRMKRQITLLELLGKNTFGGIMRILKGYKKILDPRDNKTWINTKRAGTDDQLMNKLGIKF